MLDLRLKITLSAGLLAGAAAVGVTLSQSPVTVARVSTAAHKTFGPTQQKVEACQEHETLPRDTTAIRLRVFSFLGPRVAISLLSHGRVIAHGERGSGWTSNVVTVPVNPLPTQTSGVRLCFTLFLNGEEFAELTGELTKPALAAHAKTGSLRGRLRVEYLRRGRSSWWSLAPSVARRMGLGHAASGTWSVLLVVALMGGVVILCSRAILTGLG